MCWAPIRMNVKGLQNDFSVLYENLNSESKLWKVQSDISLRRICAHTEEHTHPPHPQICCRISADLPPTCNVLRPSHETSSVETYKGTECLLSDHQWRLWRLNPGENLSLQLPTVSSPISPFQWGQWPQLHPVVAPSCKIGCFHSSANYVALHLLYIFLNPKPVNSKKKSISTQYLSVPYYSLDNISKRGRTGRIDRLCVGGRTAWCLNGLITVLLGRQRPHLTFNITILSERKKMSVTLGLLALCSILYSLQGIWGCYH